MLKMSNPLPITEHRCTGLYDHINDAHSHCPQRDSCERYLSFSRWDEQLDTWQGMTVKMARIDCADKLEQAP